MDYRRNYSRIVCYFSRLRSNEFLEARIIPERIEHRIKPEQCWSERYSGQARIR
jgi:hypothetical protein